MSIVYEHGRPVSITRAKLAAVLTADRHPSFAERIRAGADPLMVVGDLRGGVTQALRAKRHSRDSLNLYEGVVSGSVEVIEDES
jgi:hypothetical protein